MSRIRSIKPEFWEDETIGLLSRDARLLFIGTWNLADDEGLLRWTPAYVKAMLFMYDDDIDADDCARMMKELEEAKLILPYIGGKTNQRLGYVINFHKHQKINRPSPGRLPHPSIPNRDDPSNHSVSNSLNDSLNHSHTDEMNDSLPDSTPDLGVCSVEHGARSMELGVCSVEEEHVAHAPSGVPPSTHTQNGSASVVSTDPSGHLLQEVQAIMATTITPKQWPTFREQATRMLQLYSETEILAYFSKRVQQKAEQNEVYKFEWTEKDMSGPNGSRGSPSIASSAGHAGLSMAERSEANRQRRLQVHERRTQDHS